MDTKENLKVALAGEAQAIVWYLAYSREADEEGYPEVAALFRSLADGEVAHALRHLSILKAIGSTRENLQNALERETHERSEVYPRYAREAREQGDHEAAAWFQQAAIAEELHERALRRAVERLEVVEWLEVE